RRRAAGGAGAEHASMAAGARCGGRRRGLGHLSAVLLEGAAEAGEEALQAAAGPDVQREAADGDARGPRGRPLCGLGAGSTLGGGRGFRTTLWTRAGR